VPRALSAARPLVLGSASPRRREILDSLGIDCVVLPASVDETTAHREKPLDYLARVVSLKRGAVLARLAERPAGAVLVADTSVTLGDEIFGKPGDVAEAERMLESLCGREHCVFTRYSLCGPDGAALRERTVASRVWLRAATRDELHGYAATGEGLDKAGAYAVQGLGAFLIERIDGSYTNVVGLPACELVQDLTAGGWLERFP
jgi:nucleoside triphosphate pyrophosphatase